MSAKESTAVVPAIEEQAEAFQDLARGFLVCLSQLLSVSRFHHLDNVSVRMPIGTLCQQTVDFCAGGRKLQVFFDKGQVFVNGQRLRFTGGSFAMVQTLAARLDARKLAGIEFRSGVPLEGLRAFLKCFNGVPRTCDDPAAAIEKGLAAAGVKEIAVLRPAQGGGGTGFEVTGDGEMAMLLYAKTVVLLRETVRCWEDPTARSFLGARTTRAIQGIISLAERNPRPFLWLVNVKDARDHLYTHGANVALLSVLIGHRLGMDRNRLCSLGAAALYHDLGGFPGSGGDAGGKEPSPEDAAAAGANLLLRLRRLDEAALSRLAVVFEHKMAARGTARPGWPRGPHLFSRIVAIAETYDTITTRRPSAPARTPDEALRAMSDMAGSRFDPDLLRVFIGILGVYPLGTLLRLDDGALAIVYHVDPSTPYHPLVKVVVTADGARVLGDGELVDLGEVDEAGKLRRKIAGAVDPAAEGINTHAFPWAGGD